MQATKKFLKRLAIFCLVASDTVVIRVRLNVKDRQRFGHKTHPVAKGRHIHRIPVTAEFQFGDELADLHKGAAFHNDAVGRDEQFAALFDLHQIFRREITGLVGNPDAPMPVQSRGRLAEISNGAAKRRLRILLQKGHGFFK